MKELGRVIGIVGSRRRNSKEDFLLVEAALLAIYNEGDVICSGGCARGADAFAYELHVKLSAPYLEYPANWDMYGKAAGFKRNSDIARLSDVLIACVAEERTGGTEDTIKKFMRIHPEGEVILV